MKAVLAFDSFKGSMSAREACHAAAEGILSVVQDAETVEIPLSDGGEGLSGCIGGRKVCFKAHGPLMDIVDAEYAVSEDGRTAYAEMASVSGLTLIEESRRNPMETTTYGVGELLLDAASRGIRHLILGIGGSATCDAGSGMMECLKEHGIQFGKASSKIMNLQHVLPKITVACDVDNPLFGENGAAYVFAPQKGATPEEVRMLDRRLREFAANAEKEGLAAADAAFVKGAGAAGGLGYGLMTFLGAELRKGTDIVMDSVRFDERAAGADIIFTGEGKSDRQTLMGKVPQGVLSRVRGRVPVMILSGCIEDRESLVGAGFLDAVSINEGDSRPLNILMQEETAMKNMMQSAARLIQSIMSSTLSLGT